jgi:hypothetical protein
MLGAGTLIELDDAAGSAGEDQAEQLEPAVRIERSIAGQDGIDWVGGR